VKRFPWVGAIIAAILFAILVSLGLWQLRRADEARILTAQLAALAHAAPRPITALTGPIAGWDHQRVSLDCAPGDTPQALRYGLRDGQIIWRRIGVCRTAVGPYDGVLVDRGIDETLSGKMAPTLAARGPGPGRLVGVLRQAGRAAWFENSSPAGEAYSVRVLDRTTIATLARAAGVNHPLPMALAVEQEDPAPAGLTPTPLAEDERRDNFGYALTWFGMAAALAVIAFVRLRRA
jgi:surfeit locus 1 family protein